jgi:hypothetical protein
LCSFHKLNMLAEMRGKGGDRCLLAADDDNSDINAKRKIAITVPLQTNGDLGRHHIGDMPGKA